MPKIQQPGEPTPNQLSLIGTPNTASSLREQTATVSGLGNFIVGKGEEYARQARDSYRVAEYSAAMARATKELNETYNQRIQNAVDKDGKPTFNSLPQDVGDEGAKIMLKNMVGLVDPVSQAKFRQSFSNTVFNKQQLAQNEARRQHLDFSRSALTQSARALIDQGVQDDPSTINNYIAEVNGIVDGAVASGVVTKQQGDEYKDAARQELRVSAYGNMIEQDPVGAAQYLSEAESAESLGLRPDELTKLNKRAQLAVQDLQRREQRQQMEIEKAFKTRQQVTEAELELGILDPSRQVGDQEIEEALQAGTISELQALKLKKKVLQNQTKVETRLQKSSDISSAIEAGGSLLQFKQQDIDNHYLESVSSTTPNGEVATLGQKANIASLYNAPVKPFQKELQFSLIRGRADEAVQAAQAMALINEKNPLPLEGFDSDSQAIGAVILTYMNGSNLSPQAAVEYARDKVLNTDKDTRKLWEQRFRSLEDVSPEYLPETVAEALGVDGFLSTPTLPAEILVATKQMLADAYTKTGDLSEAKEIVRQQTKGLYGESQAFPDVGVMFLPPEAVYNGVDSETIKADFDEAVKDLGEGVTLRSDNLTGMSRTNPTWPVFQTNNIGVLVPVYADDGSQLRWSLDTKRVSQLRAESATKKRTAAFEAQTAQDERLKRRLGLNLPGDS